MPNISRAERARRENGKSGGRPPIPPLVTDVEEEEEELASAPPSDFEKGFYDMDMELDPVDQFKSDWNDLDLRYEELKKQLSKIKRQKLELLEEFTGFNLKIVKDKKRE
jgi:hypothetical protein